MVDHTTQNGWAAYVDAVATVAGVMPSAVSPETKLIEDLGLDSLAVTELVVALSDTYGAKIYDRLEEQHWPGLTVKQCWDRFVQGNARPTRLVVREVRR